MPEVRLPCPRRHDEAVERVRAHGVVQTSRRDSARVEVEARDGLELDLGVALLAQDVADGWRNLSLGEDAGGELVEQRLEEVVVLAVDESHLHGGALAAPCREPPA